MSGYEVWNIYDPTNRMSTDSKNGYYESLEAIRTELSILSNNPKAPFASAKFQKFLFESIHFINTSSGDSQLENCEEWFNILCQVLEALIHRTKDWDAKHLTYQIILTYLSHHAHHLVKIDGIPLEWYLTLGYAILELLAAYSLVPSSQQDFIAKLASNVYGLLYKAVKEMKTDCETNVGKMYEMLLLASTIQSLDVTNKNRDGLKSAKEFLTNFTQQNLAEKCLPSEVTKLFFLAVNTFTLQLREIGSESSMCYFIDLFRLISRQSDLCETLLACNGDMYKIKVPKITSHFSCDSVDQLIKKNRAATLEIKENLVHEVVLSVLKFTFKLAPITDLQSISSSKSGKKMKNMEKGTLDLNLMKDTQNILARRQEILSDTHKPVSIAISDSLVTLARLKVDPKVLCSEVLLVLYELLSLSVEIFVRDVISRASKDSQVTFVSLRIYSLAVAEKTRLLVLQALLQHDISDKMSCLAQLQKSSVNSLFNLVLLTKKKNLLASFPNGNTQVFRSLGESISALGRFGKLLRLREKYSEAIELLSPFWPMPIMDDLLPHISHHESLAECYRLTSQHNKVYQVVATAAKIDYKLLTDSLVKTLVRLAKQEVNLPVLKIFESCKENEATHAKILGKVLRMMLQCSYSSSLHKITIKVLECLTCHPGLAASDKAMYSTYLADIRWYSSHESTEKKMAPGDLLEMLKESSSVLTSQSGHTYDDVLAQSAFLYWETLHRLTCLVKANLTEEPADTDSPDCTLPVSMPLNSSKLTNSLDLHTPMEAVGTPKRPQTDSKIFQSPVSRKKIKQVKEVQREQFAPPCQVDSEMLMTKVKDCLAVWVKWFTIHQDDFLHWEDGSFRAARSLSFLNKVAEVARVNHNIVVALQAVSYAKNLASKMKDTEAVQRFTSKLLSLMSQLGVGYNDGSSLIDSSEKDLFAEEDTFLSSLGLSQDMHVLDLVCVADYYLRIGEINRFIQVCDVVLQIIDKCRDKGPLTASTSTALAIIKRLLAEFYSSPQVKEHSHNFDETFEAYPTIQFGDSVKYISSVAMFYLGKDYKNVETRVEQRRQNLLSSSDASFTNPATASASEEKYGLTLSCYSEQCSCCFQSPLAQIITELMWHQADIYKRNEGPVISVLNSLNTANCSAQMIKNSSFRETVRKLFSECGLTISVGDSPMNTNYEWVLETLTRLAEVLFHWVYAGDTSENISVDSVQHFLDYIIQSGKLFLNTNKSNILLAAAQLLRIHLQYLSSLQHTPDEGGTEHLGECVPDEKIIELEVAEVKSFKSYWDSKKTLDFVSSLESASSERSSHSEKIISEASPRAVSGSGTKTIHSTPFLSPLPSSSVFQTEKRAASRKTYTKSLYIFDDSQQSSVSSCKNVKKSTESVGRIHNRRTKTVPDAQGTCAIIDINEMSVDLQNMHISINSDRQSKESKTLELGTYSNRKRQSPVASRSSLESASDTSLKSVKDEHIPVLTEVTAAKKSRTGKITRQKAVNLTADAGVVSEQSGKTTKKNSMTIQENSEVEEVTGKIIRRRRKIITDHDLEIDKKFAPEVVLQEIDNMANQIAPNKVQREARTRRENKCAIPKGKENVEVTAPKRIGRKKMTKIELPTGVDSLELERSSVYLTRSPQPLNTSPFIKIISSPPICHEEIERFQPLEDSCDGLLNVGQCVSPLMQARSEDWPVKHVQTYFSPIEIPRGRKKCQMLKDNNATVSSKAKRGAKKEAENIPEKSHPVGLGYEPLIGALETSLKKTQHFPQSFMYSQISRCLAAEEYNNHASIEIRSKTKCDEVDERKIAAHLTDSMHVTFQHLMIRNLGSKLRKCKKSKVKGEKEEPSDWSNLQGDELTSEVSAMSEALNKLKHNGEAEMLNSRLSNIPEGMYIPKLKHNGEAEMLNSRLSNIPEGMYIPKLKHNGGAEMLNS
ncbi:hypothetical protein Btru_035118 [Bulinus truncatus]|nr:hypothetical protein Btru_035118 [Bulinus truncatus]